MATELLVNSLAKTNKILLCDDSALQTTSRNKYPEMIFFLCSLIGGTPLLVCSSCCLILSGVILSGLFHDFVFDAGIFLALL